MNYNILAKSSINVQVVSQLEYKILYAVFDNFISFGALWKTVKSYFTDICKQLKPAEGAMNVFLGLNASNEELNLKPHNIWAFTTNDSGTCYLPIMY